MIAARRARPLWLEGLALMLGVLALASAVPAIVVAWMAVVFHVAPRPPELVPLSPAVSALATFFYFLPSLTFASASVLIRFFAVRRD